MLVVRNSTGLVSVGESARTVTSKHMQALACKGVPVADLAKMSGVGRAMETKGFDYVKYERTTLKGDIS